MAKDLDTAVPLAVEAEAGRADAVARQTAAENAEARARALVEKFDIEPFSQPNHQTLEGSFSAVSTPNFATKASFFSIFQDLQDPHTFAPLGTRTFGENCPTFPEFLQNFQNFVK